VPASLSSRDRLLAAIEHRPVDHVPLCFEGICHGSVVPIDRRYPDSLQRAEYYLALGVDHVVSVSPPAVSARVGPRRHWQQQAEGESVPLRCAEYATPDGPLRQVVRASADYPHMRVPLFSDHHVPPGRSLEYLVSKPCHLPALAHLLRVPDGDELEAFRAQFGAARRFCDANGLLLSGDVPGVGDPLMWMSGIEPVLLAAVQQPGFLAEYVAVVARWNLQLTAILIDAGADVIVRRGWYESTDFWSPALYRQFLLPPLRQEVHLAHQARAKLVYVMNTGAMPLLPHFLDVGFDVLSNVDPVAPGVDLGQMKAALHGRICVCGGVNNTHVLEEGDAADVEAAVRAALAAAGGGTGFILAPGDSAGFAEGTDRARAWRNVESMVAAWKALR